MELYKEIYYNEIDRKKWLDTLIKLPISWIIILIGSFIYILKEINLIRVEICESELLSNISFAISTLVFISIVYSLLFILKMFYGNEYHYIPSPKDIFEKQLRHKSNYLNQNSDPNDVTDEDNEMSMLYSINEINDELVKHYVNCGDNNQKINDRRLSYYYKIRLSMILTIIFLFLLAILNFNLMIK